MKKISLAVISLSPALAMAHEGHHGVGMFHHAMDLAPVIAVAAIVVGGLKLMKR